DRAWLVAALCAPTEERFPVRGKRISTLYPFVDGEVRYAVRHEYAQTAVDVLARRTRLAFLNAQAALEALPKVIDIMAGELKWDSKRKETEWRDSRFLFLPLISRMMFSKDSIFNNHLQRWHSSNPWASRNPNSQRQESKLRWEN